MPTPLAHAAHSTRGSNDRGSRSRHPRRALALLVFASACQRTLPVVEDPPSASTALAGQRAPSHRAGEPGSGGSGGTGLAAGSGVDSADAGTVANDSASGDAVGMGGAAAGAPADGAEPTAGVPAAAADASDSAQDTAPAGRGIDIPDNLPRLSCDGAKDATPIETGQDSDVRAVAVASDTLFFATLSNVYSMPKDGSAPPTLLVEYASPSSLAVLGDKLYYPDTGGEVKALSFDGKHEASAFDLDSNWLDDLATDGQAIYATAVGCAGAMPVVYTPDAAPKTLDVMCPQAIAGRDGAAYVIAGESSEKWQLLKLGASGAAQVLVPANAAEPLGDELAVTDAYAYFYVDDQYLARVPVGGGDMEYLVGDIGLPDSLWATDHEVIIEVTNGAGNMCLSILDERSTTLKPLANVWNVWNLAADDTAFYAATNSLYRIARP